MVTPHNVVSSPSVGVQRIKEEGHIGRRLHQARDLPVIVVLPQIDLDVDVIVRCEHAIDPVGQIRSCPLYFAARHNGDLQGDAPFRFCLADHIDVLVEGGNNDLQILRVDKRQGERAVSLFKGFTVLVQNPENHLGLPRHSLHIALVKVVLEHHLLLLHILCADKRAHRLIVSVQGIVPMRLVERSNHESTRTECIRRTVDARQGEQFIQPLLKRTNRRPIVIPFLHTGTNKDHPVRELLQSGRMIRRNDHLRCKNVVEYRCSGVADGKGICKQLHIGTQRLQIDRLRMNALRHR